MENLDSGCLTCAISFLFPFTRQKKMLKWAPTFCYFLNISLACYISVPSRSFIKHWRSENSPSSMHNSLVKFQWSMVIFYSEESDVDTLCYCKKKYYYSKKCVILALSHLLYVPKEITIIHKRSHLNASSFKPNKTNRGHVKYLTVCWRVDCWLYAQRFFILHAKKY